MLKLIKRTVIILMLTAIIGIIILNRNVDNVWNGKNEKILAEKEITSNKIGADSEPTQTENIKDNRFKSSNMPYSYEIDTGKISVENNKYIIQVQDDGVILIYNNSQELIASSKEQLPSSDEYPADYRFHVGVGETKTVAPNLQGKTEEELYSIYADTPEAQYQGTDITKYNEELHKKYTNYTDNGNKINFKNIIFEIANKTTYMLDKKIHEEAEGASEENPTTIVLEKGQYLVNCDSERNRSYLGSASEEGGYGITIPSNVTLNLNGSIVKQINDSTLNESSESNYYNWYAVLRISCGENIRITNGILVGDKAERTYTRKQSKDSTGNGADTGEHGRGIYVYAKDTDQTIEDNIVNKNITIDTLVLKYMSGDGIEINSSCDANNHENTSKNINIQNNFIYCCNRQGISVVNANEVNIINNTIYNIVGAEPSDCIDIEPNVNFKGKTGYSIVNNYSASSVDDIKIYKNILNNYHALSTRYNVGDTTIANNEILGRIQLFNSDGKIEFNNNIVKNGINGTDARTIYIGGNKNYRPDNNGEGYVIDGTGNKNCPECLLMYDNQFYISNIISYKATFADIYQNTFYNSFERFYFLESDKSYKDMYIHGNSFEYRVNNSVPVYMIEKLEGVKLNIYDNIYYDKTASKNDNEYMENEYINEDAEENLADYINRDINYIKIVKPSKKQVYWVGKETKETFDADGMEVGIYTLRRQTDETEKITLEEVGKLVFNHKKIYFNTGKSVQEVVSSTVTIEENEQKKEYKIIVSEDVMSTTTMAKVSLENEQNVLSAYQKVRTNTAVDMKNEEITGTINSDRENYIKREGILDNGTDIAKICNIYSMFYCFDTKYNTKTESERDYGGPKRVEKEFVKWSIINPDGRVKEGKNATIIEENDWNNGKITIQAEYCGLTIKKIIENNGLFITKNEIETRDGFLGSTNKNPSLIRQYINSVQIYSSDAKNNIDRDKSWIVGSIVNNNETVPILAWYDSSGEAPFITYNVYIAPDTETKGVKVKANTNSSYLFANIGANRVCTAGKDGKVILGLENLDTSQTKDMSYMFYNCGTTAMKELDVSRLDMTLVNNMAYMFAYPLTSSGSTNIVEKITFGNNFNTSKVTNMEGMFKGFGWNKLKSLDLSSFNTENVTNMSQMFYGTGYKIMTSLNLGNTFNTENVTNMNNMFRGTGTTKLATLDLGENFNTANVIDMTEMFRNCGQNAMEEIKLGNQFTKIADNHNNIFKNCGIEGCKVYIPNILWISENTCKLNSNSIDIVDVTNEKVRFEKLLNTYIVEHYKEDIDGEYAKDESQTEIITGVVNTNVEATAKTFDGFTYDEDNANNVKSGKVSSDDQLILKLYYTRNQYTITFILDNGEENITKIQKWGTPLEAPTNIKKEGYIFDGWSEEIPSIMPKENKAYTAKWKESKQIEVVIDEKYEVKEDGKTQIKYITKIEATTTIKNLINNIETNASKIEIIDRNGKKLGEYEKSSNGTYEWNGKNETKEDEKNIGTGYKIKMSLNGETIYYTAVVTGDLTGNGIIDQGDILMFAKYAVGNLEENVQEENKKISRESVLASDLNHDGNYADQGDLLKLAKTLVD